MGQKQANELGLFDMSGNVWKWCSDWYDENYYESSTGANPLGAGYGQFRAERGGSLNNIPENCRVGNRNWIKPESRSYHLGFRLAHSAE